MACATNTTGDRCTYGPCFALNIWRPARSKRRIELHWSQTTTSLMSTRMTWNQAKNQLFCSNLMKAKKSSKWQEVSMKKLGSSSRTFLTKNLWEISVLLSKKTEKHQRSWPQVHLQPERQTIHPVGQTPYLQIKRRRKIRVRPSRWVTPTRRWAWSVRRPI